MSLEELKKALKEKKLIYGTNETLKKLKTGKIKVVFVASNCPPNVKKSIEHYSKLCGTKIIELSIPDSEIGLLCKKRHSIVILSF